MRVEDLTGFDAVLFYGFITIAGLFIVCGTIYIIWDYFDEKKRAKRRDATMNNLFRIFDNFNALQRQLDAIIMKLQISKN